MPAMTLGHELPLALPAAVDHAVPDLRLRIETLGGSLPFLLLRDDARPGAWLSAAFASRVAAVRTLLAAAASLADLVHLVRQIERQDALGLGRGRGMLGRMETWTDRAEPDDGSRPGTFETAAGQLARDAASVAVAIRWQESHGGMRLPAWPEILRSGLSSVRVVERDHDLERALWFG